MGLPEWNKREQLEREAYDAELEARASHKMAMNSYGAGYDRGFADGIKRAIAEVWSDS